MILCCDVWPISVSTNILLQRFPLYISTKCNLLEIPLGFLSRWCHDKGKMSGMHIQCQTTSSHCIIHNQVLLARKHCCQLSSTVTERRVQFLTEDRIAIRERGWCGRKMRVKIRDVSHSWLGFATRASHFTSLDSSGPLGLMFLQMKDTSCHKKIPKPGCAPESFEKLF